MESVESGSISETSNAPVLPKQSKFPSKKMKFEQEQLGRGSRKWRTRVKKVVRGGSSSSQTRNAFNLFNCEIEYRVCGTILMLKTEDILLLTKTALGLKTDIGKSSPVGAIIKHLRTASKFELLMQDEDKAWLRSHISWKAYHELVTTTVTDIAIREMLNDYVPFQSRKFSTDDASDHGPSLEKDCLKLAGITVPFSVSRGRIFLDLLASFTVLGQLRLAFMNNWDQVDTILEEQGLNQKDAFRRNHKSRAKDRRWNSQRSHITFKAIRVLAEHGLVEESGRRRMLSQLFSHLDSEVSRVLDVVQTLLKQLEAKMKELLTDAGVSPDPHSHTKKFESSSHTGEEELIGTELCDSGCGRQYHFTVRCCSKPHQMKLCGKTVSYIVSHGQIFLEKCGAFSALGRMYVIRCSDYRRSDKTLVGGGLKPRKHYLYESHTKPDQLVHERRRNRRTHISFEALSTLVKCGFADQARIEELTNALNELQERLEDLKSDCLRYSKSKFDEDETTQNKQDSSSGIESGSSPLCSGANSPISFEDKSSRDAVPKVKPSPKNQKFPQKKIKIVGQSINTCIHMNQIFLSVSDVCQCLTNKDKSLSRLKRLSRDLDLTLTPPLKKLGGKHFVSLECLVGLMESRKVSTVSQEFQDAVTALQTNDPEEGPQTVKTEKMETEDSESSSGRSQRVVTENPTTNILGIDVPVRVVNNMVFVDKNSVFEILKITAPSHVAFRSVDKALENAGVCVDESFLYEGRRRSFISTKAVRVLASNHNDAVAIMSALDDVDKRCDSLRVNRLLKLTSVDLPVRIISGVVFLSTVHFLTAVGFRRSYMLPNPSKAYFIIVRLLKRRGLNIGACFLKMGKSKYAYISVYAAFTLFKTEFGPFRDKKRIDRFKKEILSAMKENGLAYQENTVESQKEKSSSSCSDEVKPKKDSRLAIISDSFPPIRFVLKDGVVFLHRKTCFEAIGVERALLTNSRGYAAINNILVSEAINLKECYIRGKQEQYAFISIKALFSLLDSEDPLFVCLEKKEDFIESLFSWMSLKATEVLSAKEFPLGSSTFGSVPYLVDVSKKIFLHRDTCFKMSGLYEKRAWDRAKMTASDNPYLRELPQKFVEEARQESPLAMILEKGSDLSKVSFLPDEFGDEHGFISVDLLWKMTRPDGEISRASEYHKLIWKDMIQAVLCEAPKLKIHAKIVEFREAVLSSLVNLLTAALQITLKDTPAASSPQTTPEPVSDQVEEILPDGKFPEQESIDDDIRATNESVEDKTTPVVAETEDGLEKDPLFIQNSCGSLILSRSEFDLAVSQVEGQTSVGEWTVRLCSASEIRLVVPPGVGASKKPSFTQPDVRAILSYELRLKPDSPPELFINSHLVSEESLRGIFSKSIKKGLFNLLYNFLTVRPCFGCFNPELVETFEKRLGDEKFQDLIVDSKFIGSSQSGRTYAGCVRSKFCTFVADSRVSDNCKFCSNLKNIVINRSILASPDCSSAPEVTSSQQLSVWKIEESSVDGCSFLCLQLQSFNTSLPHQFKSSQQATSVVSHRVHISKDLQLKISLNGAAINGRTYPDDFEKNKQVGPLLDWVASLRLCIGYPDPLLVDRATYVCEKKDLLPPETRKFFDYIYVDEVFSWKKMNSNESRHRGTLRTPSCRFVAGDYADICDQCRLLQEPLEFLGVKKPIQ